VVSDHELTTQLLELGVKPDGVLLVHASFSKVAPIEEGPRGLIAALYSYSRHVPARLLKVKPPNDFAPLGRYRVIPSLWLARQFPRDRTGV
jgi:aminoglycoside N3'-acetyltransferase